jgi:hypothetical protein
MTSWRGHWANALKGWINVGGHPELTKAWMWGE